MDMDRVMYLSSKQAEWRELYLKQENIRLKNYYARMKKKFNRPFECECGTILQYEYNLPNHLNSNKHFKLLKKKQSNK